MLAQVSMMSRTLLLGRPPPGESSPSNHSGNGEDAADGYQYDVENPSMKRGAPSPHPAKEKKPAPSDSACWIWVGIGIFLLVITPLTLVVFFERARQTDTKTEKGD